MLYFINNLYIRIILGGFFALFAVKANSQSTTDSQNVEVTFNKTSSIVFPAVITSVDRGSRDVLAQKAKGVNNVLQLKAGRTNFKETNLTVITADGKLHHFFVRYADQPSTFTIQAFQTDNGGDPDEVLPLLFQSEMTTEEMDNVSEAILDAPRKIRITSTAKYDMHLALQGIYIHGNIMFYHLKVSNKSNIPFHTDMLRFFVKDKQKVKRTASQELTETPVYHFGNAEVIGPNTTEDLIYAIPKFTIPNAKVLTIELMEKRGGRHLLLSIKNKTIVNARATPGE